VLAGLRVRSGTGKLTSLLRELEEQAFERWRPRHPGEPTAPGVWGRIVWGQIERQWMDWRRGIPPSRDWRGRGGQNPWLLRAFECLDQAEARAKAAPVWRQPQAVESPAAFAARVKASI